MERGGILGYLCILWLSSTLSKIFGGKVGKPGVLLDLSRLAPT